MKAGELSCRPWTWIISPRLICRMGVEWGEVEGRGERRGGKQEATRVENLHPSFSERLHVPLLMGRRMWFPTEPGKRGGFSFHSACAPPRPPTAPWGLLPPLSLKWARFPILLKQGAWLPISPRKGVGHPPILPQTGAGVPNLKEVDFLLPRKRVGWRRVYVRRRQGFLSHIRKGQDFLLHQEKRIDLLNA